MRVHAGRMTDSLCGVLEAGLVVERMQAPAHRRHRQVRHGIHRKTDV